MKSLTVRAEVDVLYPPEITAPEVGETVALHLSSMIQPEGFPLFHGEYRVQVTTTEVTWDDEGKAA